MLLILPILAFLFFYFIFRALKIEWRRAALAAAVFCGTCVVVITEMLSLPRLLTRGYVAIFWLAICVVSFLFLRTIRRRMAPPSQLREPPHTNFDPATKGLLIAASVIVLLVGITAFVSPPNMWDAMEYHLGRVTMWMSQHSVRFFPTPDYSHLIFGPWAEYAMMHTYLLWGTDRFVNFVEFFSMLGSVLGVSLIAGKLGAGTRGQALAAVACATLPEGVLEASGPMNTCVVSFWVMTTVAFFLSWNDDPSWLNTTCLGLAAGLAVLTKGTAYVYLPFLVLACWLMGSPVARVRFLKRCAVLVLLILAVNGAQYFRNYGLTGSPLGLPFADGGPRLHWMMDRFSPQAGLANVLRNISLHTVTPSSAVNSEIEKLFRLAIRAVGANPDDLQAIRLGDSFQLNHFSLHELHAGNPLQLLLLLLAVGAALWKGGQRGCRKPFWFAMGLVFSFLFFSTLLKWDIWAGRHQLPLFVLGSALIGWAMDTYFSRKAGIAVGIALVAYALPFALANRTRSLIPWNRVDDVYHSRSLLYFSDGHEEIASVNIAAASEVNRLNCGNVAFDSYAPQPASQLPRSPKSFFVYPLFAMIHADGRTRTVWYTGVHNWSTRYAEYEHHPEPCAVVCLECAGIPEKWAEYRGVGGRASVFDYIVVFSAAGQVVNAPAGTGLGRDNEAVTVQPGGQP